MPWGEWWGGSYDKRSRSKDCSTECGECGDMILMDEEEYDSCGDCQRTLCSACCPIRCDFCKEIEENGDMPSTAEGSTCCESCFESCESCEAAAKEETGDEYNGPTFHKCCLAEHLKICSHKSRTQRKLSSANHQSIN